MAVDKRTGAYVNCWNNQGNVYYIAIGSVKVLSRATCYGARTFAHSVVRRAVVCYETSEHGNNLVKCVVPVRACNWLRVDLISRVCAFGCFFFIFGPVTCCNSVKFT